MLKGGKSMLSLTVLNCVVPGVPNVLPIGPLMIASIVRQAGYDAKFYDYQTFKVTEGKISPDVFYQFLKQADTEIVALGAMSGNMPTILPAIKRYKEDYPDKKIILGGPGATDTPLEIMKSCPIDFIVYGEGEFTTVDLLKAIETGADFSKVRGIWYRSKEGIVRTEPRERITDLDSLPYPAYDLINFDDYDNGLHIMTSRGCPYNCKFCSTHTIWGHQVTERSIESIVEEIETIKERITWITFCDDNLALKPDRQLKLCRMLREKNIKLPWMTYGRINLMTEELVKEMVAAGCEEIFFGIESGSQRILNILEKKIDLEHSRNIIKMTAKHVLQVNTSYIWGYPFENVDDLVDTLLAVGMDEQIENVVPHLYLLGPFVNTPIYKEYHQSLKFSPDFIPNVGSVPVSESVKKLPDVCEFIEKHPQICTPFYHYDHPDLREKQVIINKIIAQHHERRKAIGPGARMKESN